MRQHGLDGYVAQCRGRGGGLEMTEQRPELPRDRWHEFFDEMTRDYEGADVTIEELRADFGDLLQVERIPLAYLEYDPKDDQFSVGVGGRDARYPVILRHAVDHPRAILADIVGEGGRWAFDVVGAEGGETIVTVYFEDVPEAATA
ncbi:hypothetical protein Ssi03_11440 [Sphaerisporangium siamense]|uniref:Uncharacterized protein n=1 Tax=Sphaerisporangium siamense TaxID=795645 RepID=A0A7W7DA52_9ACTN|nr:DUF5335 family protein [Sphaerisporangium siamense]MBB4703080.1 hypothetical protein [Sphaerisporangium siamense]GII83154.1 hypothetical protein Ssi03_11440 [Sphaerisporangium siamense]